MQVRDLFLLYFLDRKIFKVIFFPLKSLLILLLHISKNLCTQTVHVFKERSMSGADTQVRLRKSVSGNISTK